ncbi:flagellar biosynthetic protein FliR [Persephonella hydrogeniphila]|uniref:Flagellar biosynthetic protein FliR n=1 Tax=Persephonella hydrogeniphila TaxID=198703 RepID=A0A285NF01_9AQUI|nr:flagellar biosynthetic protein FliR [Persephonella hydrogeniphila]SNZ08082.1 flagellar biosynthetic protein FliR [Persephonella hydrogeniphila]
MNPLITPDMAVALGLVMSRVVGIFLGFPLLNTALIPLNIRIMLVIAFSFFFMSIFDLKFPVENFSLLHYTLLVLRELLIGFLLGLVVNIFIAAFSYAAELISYFMGFTIVNVFDPTFGQISVLDRFFILLFYLLFFVTGAYKMVIGGMVMSFKLIPVGQTSFNVDIFVYLLKEAPLLFYLAFKMAFPFVLILFMVNVALALINRLIPQINVFIVGLPLQIFVGLATLAVGTSLVIYFSVSVINHFAENYIKAIGIMGK